MRRETDLEIGQLYPGKAPPRPGGYGAAKVEGEMVRASRKTLK